MKLKILIESLHDISTENVLYHYTNIQHLFSILDSGYLKGMDYNIKATEKNDAKEIATTRKSTVTRINSIKSNKLKNFVKNNLSENIGCVMFHLYPERIVSGVRGVKVKPIAEIPKRSIKEIKDFFEKLGVQYKKEYVNFLLSRYRYYKKNKYSEHELMPFLGDDIAKEFNINYRDIDLYAITGSIRSLNNLLIYRENEERFVLNNNKIEGIPVNKNFMKIEFISDPTKEIKRLIEIGYIGGIFNNNGSASNDEVKKRMLNTIEKNEQIFIKNQYYNKLIKWLQK